MKVDYFKGAPLTNKPDKPKEDVSPEDYQKALAAAGSADVIIYVGGLDTELEGEENHYQSEGFSYGDRTNIELPATQEKLLHDLQATGKPVVFVNCSGSAIGSAMGCGAYPGHPAGMVSRRAGRCCGGRCPLWQLQPFGTASDHLLRENRRSARFYRLSHGQPHLPLFLREGAFPPSALVSATPPSITSAAPATPDRKGPFFILVSGPKQRRSRR